MSNLSGRFTQSPNETRRYVLDFTQQLSLGETLVSLVPTITPVTPAPVSPALSVTSIVIAGSGNQAVFYVSGGVAGNSYEISFITTTSITQIFEDIVQIDVASKA